MAKKAQITAQDTNITEKIDEPEPKEASEATPPLVAQNKAQRLRAWFGTHKKIGLLMLAFALLILLLIPSQIRYAVLGSFVKKDVTILVSDSKSGKPISETTVSLGKTTAKTDANGKAVLRKVRAGKHQISLAKKYYRSSNFAYTVPLLGKSKALKQSMVATGQQVTVKVTNIVSG
jgi:hypothetical protein